MSAIQNAIPQFNFVQASFALYAKARIIDELIKNNSTVAFIEDVLAIDKRLDQGLVIELRQLELELICAGKLGSQSDALYSNFLSHVTALCDAFYNNDASIKSRASHHLDTIYNTQQMLSSGEDAEEVGLQEPTDADQGQEADFKFDFGIPDSGYSTMDFSNGLTESMQAEVDAFAREADAIGGFGFGSSPFPATSSFNTSSSSLPIPQHSASFNTSSSSLPMPSFQNHTSSRLSSQPQQQAHSPNHPPGHLHNEASISKYRCHCGYEPSGEEKWKGSNLARHKRIQHATHKYRCGFRGCKSEFTRSDNLRSHQRDKGHEMKVGMALGTRPDDVEGDEREMSTTGRRPSKKQKTGEKGRERGR